MAGAVDETHHATGQTKHHKMMSGCGIALRIRGRNCLSFIQQDSLAMSKSENKNALKHGAFSQALILPGEDPNDLQELLTALRANGIPRGLVRTTRSKA